MLASVALPEARQLMQEFSLGMRLKLFGSHLQPSMKGALISLVSKPPTQLPITSITVLKATEPWDLGMMHGEGKE